MPTFADLAAYTASVTAKLTKPRRGVSGSEGVLASDVLSALVDCGTFLDDRAGTSFVKAPKQAYGSAKGFEFWASGGATFGFSADYLEGSIKSFNTGGSAPEMELWNVFSNARFSFKDGGAKTERFRLAAGNAWLSGNMHVGAGADRTNKAVALYVAGNAWYNSGTAPATSQLKITADNVGALSFLNYTTDNVSIAFDAEYAGGFVAKHNSWAFIYKEAGVLRFKGDSGLTPGTIYTPTNIMSIELDTKNVIVGNALDNLLGKMQIHGDVWSSGSYFSPGDGFRSIKDGSSTFNAAFYQQSISGTTYAMNVQMTPTGGIGFWTYAGSWANRVTIKETGQLRFVPLSADPSGAENGDAYYNSTTHKLRVYANGAWVNLH